ncbi:MAG: Do family serine endopeptidase [Bdellovibrionota bacterium]|mgnify:CR=1 FL=1
MYKILPCITLILCFNASAESANTITNSAITKSSAAFSEIAKKAMPAVVSINTVKTTTESMLDPEALLPDQMTPGMPEATADISVNAGSGIIIRPNGTILTNHHVIVDAEKITVSLDEKQKITAHVVGTDPRTDLAVIRLDQEPRPANLPTLRFGDSDDAKIGDLVLAIGSPFGLPRSVTLGIISAKGRAQVGSMNVDEFIQTDAAINPGSSGGPLLNSKGEIIGINTAIFSQNGGFIGIGFAISGKVAKEITEQIITYGKAIRGWIGLTAQDLEPGMAKHLRMEKKNGALVSDILPSGPADKASIKAGDVIVKYNNTEVMTADQLRTLVGKTKTGSNIDVALIRDSKAILTHLLITEPPYNTKAINQRHKYGPDKTTAKNHDSGLSVDDIPEELIPFFGSTPPIGALVVSIRPGSPAFDAGLLIGDIVVSVDKTRIRSAKELRKALSDPRSHLLYIQRGNSNKLFALLDSA